mgnify:CR=1 FL=1
MTEKVNVRNHVRSLGHRSKLDLEGSWGRGAAPMLPKVVSRCPLRLKMEPKWNQKWSHNSHDREIDSTNEQRDERSWHTLRATPRREKLAYPQSSAEKREL